MLQWILILENARKNEKARDAFADPLEGEDWRGLGWLAELMAASRRHRRRQPERNQNRATATFIHGRAVRTSP